MAEGSIKAAHKCTNTPAKLHLHKLYTRLENAVVLCLKKKERKENQIPQLSFKRLYFIRVFSLSRAGKRMRCYSLTAGFFLRLAPLKSYEGRLFLRRAGLRGAVEGMKLIWKLLLSNH